MNQQQKQFLNDYLDTLDKAHSNHHSHVVADYFCADEENANLCSELILKGEKTASCSLKYWYESGQEPMPKVGNLQVVTDWYGKPTSIIEIIEVSECRFIDVSEAFAILEGEGDKSLDWWRQTHWQFFVQECQAEGIVPSENMLLVLEKFKVVF